MQRAAMASGGGIWSFFHGRWTFRRRVTSLVAPHNVMATINDGRASFVPWVWAMDGAPGMAGASTRNGACLLYREQGTLTHQDLSGTTSSALASRQYMYHFSPDCATEIRIHQCGAAPGVDRSAPVIDPWSSSPPMRADFAHGAFFHDLQFPNFGKSTVTDLISSCTHFCSPDVYEGRYEIHNDRHFVIKWTVTGPRKRYTIETAFQKVGKETDSDLKKSEKLEAFMNKIKTVM